MFLMMKQQLYKFDARARWIVPWKQFVTTDDNWLIASSSFFTASGVSFDIHHRIFGVNYGPFLNAKAALDYQNILSVAFSNI